MTTAILFQTQSPDLWQGGREEKQDVLKGKATVVKELWYEVFAKRFHTQFLIPIFPWCFLNTWAIADLPVPQCMMPVENPVTQQNSETLHLGQSHATGVLGKLRAHCELCFYHLSSVKDVHWGLLLSASRSTAEQYFSKVMLLLTHRTFSGVNCKSSIQKIRLSFLS